MKRRHLVLCIALITFGLGLAGISFPNHEGPDWAALDRELQSYLQWAYETMDKDYYLPVSHEVYEKFVEEMPVQKLYELNERNKKTENFVHLAGGLMILRLRNEEDAITNLIPPDKTEAFREKAYAVTIDLGLTGNKTPQGFIISNVQKHSDAFAGGIRPGDILIRINEYPTEELTEDRIEELLKPQVGSRMTLEILFSKTQVVKMIELESKSYYEETLSFTPTDREGVLIIKVSHFNRKTSDDFADEINQFGIENIRHLILDLRDNTGGPPLAARELMGYFTPGDDTLFFIVRKNRSPFQLNAPLGKKNYEGPLTILVNSGTGSAAETFSGVLQKKKRALVVGQKTAGGAYLKGLFDHEDGSSILMVTSRTFFHDRNVFPKDGITPDIELPIAEDPLEFVFEDILS